MSYRCPRCDWYTDPLQPELHTCGPTAQSILLDLIAELRNMTDGSEHLSEWIGPDLDRAESRLLEVLKDGDR